MTEFKDPRMGKILTIPAYRFLNEFDYDWDKDVWIEKKTGKVFSGECVKINIMMEDNDQKV